MGVTSSSAVGMGMLESGNTPHRPSQAPNPTTPTLPQRGLSARSSPPSSIPPPMVVDRRVSVAVPAFSTPLAVGVTGQANGGLATWSDEFNPTVAEDASGNIYVTWASDSSGAWAIYWAGSTNGGASFASPAPTLLWSYSNTSGYALVGPSIAVTPSGGSICIVFLSSQESTDGGTQNDPYGDYYHACSSNEGSAWSSLTGDSSYGTMCSVATNTIYSLYGGIYDPVGAFDANGNYIVAAFAAPTGNGCSYRGLGWEVWTGGGTTYSSTYWLANSIPDYFATTNDVAIACGSAAAGCATLYAVSDGNGNATINPSHWLVKAVSSTTDFGTTTGPFTLATHAWTTSYTNVGAWIAQGDLAFASTGTDAAAAFDMNAGTSTTVTFTVDYSYSSNAFTTVPGAATSPAGGATGLGQASIALVGSSAAPFVAWSTSANAMTVTSATSQGGKWNTAVTLSTNGDYPALASYNAVSGSPAWRTDLLYIGTGTNPQVYYAYQTAPYASAFNPSPASIDANQTVVFSPTFTGGTGSYSAYSWTASSTNFGCGIANAATYTCAPKNNTGSPYTVSVSVTDSWGFVGTSTSPSFSVYSDPSVGIPTASPPSGGIDYGQPLNVTFTSATPTGGAPGAFGYSWTTLPAWCANSKGSTMTCTPTSSGNFSVGVTVTDSNSFAATSPNLTYAVNGPLSAKLAGSAPVIDMGQTVNISTIATGGSGSYTYLYTGLPAGCTSTAAAFSCSPSTTGNSSIVATVTDTNGVKASTNYFNLTVNSDPTITTALSVSPASITIGASITLTVSASGGTGALTYTYGGLPGGCSTQSVATFTCTPTATGTFTVSVVVSDTIGMKSAPSRASLSVKSTPPSISNFVATPASIQSGQSTTFTVTASGGTPPLIYVYTALPAGCSSQNQSSLPCTPTATGTFTVKVTVTDSLGLSISSTTPLTVTVGNGPSVGSFSASPSTVAPGQATTFKVTVTGGTSPYTYAYSGLPPGCASSNTASLSCMPTSSGSFSVTVVVTDSKGLTAQGSTSLTVSSVAGAPTISSFAATPNPVAEGSTTTMTVVVSGGTAPYSFIFTGLPPGCSSQDSNQLSCKPTSPGNFTVGVTVTDSAQHSTTKNLVLTVTGTVSPLSVSLSSNSTSIPAGSGVLLSALVSGGIGPFTYTWSLNGTNVSYGPDEATWTDALPHTGTYVFKVWVADAKGKVASSSTVSVQVVPPHSTNAVPEASQWWIVLLIVAAVAIGMIAYADHRRRVSRQVSRSQEAAAAMAVAPLAATPGTSTVAEVPSEPGYPDYLATSSPAAGDLGYAAEAPAPPALEGAEGYAPPTTEEIPAATSEPTASYPTETPAESPPTETPDVGYGTSPVPEATDGGTAPEYDPAPVPSAEASPVPESGAEALAPEAMYLLPEVPGGAEEPSLDALSSCPQCGTPLTSESYCSNCAVQWVRDPEGWPAAPAPAEAPPSEPVPAEAPSTEEISPEPQPLAETEPESPPPMEPLTQCPQCGGPLDAEMGCETCGVIWERQPESPSEMPESSADLPEGPSYAAEDQSLPPPPTLDASVNPPTEDASSSSYLGRVCLVCGGPLEGDYCSTCDMHWESGGPR